MYIQDKSNIVINEQSEIRKKEIKFTIGMIVTHSSDLCLSSLEGNSPHDGVIIGWHYKCKAAFVHKNLNSLVPHLSECYENQYSQRLCTFETCKSNNSKFICQPHYIILTENNIMCYVPQGICEILVAFSFINYVYFYIQSVPKVPERPNISKIKHFREKCFLQKL